jgi:hypothetical protein
MGPADSIYLKDDGGHFVRKCSLDGKVVSELAMRAFLSRLFRRPRVDAPAWIEVDELQRRHPVSRRQAALSLPGQIASRPATPLSWSMCVNPRNSPRLQATCAVPSTCRWPIYQGRGPANLPPSENRSCWFVKPIAAVLRGGTDGLEGRFS